MAINTQSLARNWFKQGLYQNTSNYDEGSFFVDNFQNLLGLSNTGVTDTRFTPALLNYMFTANPLAFGIYNKIQSAILSKKFRFCGKNELKNKYYQELLEQSGFRKRLFESLMPAFWGTGGGNALYYVVKNGGKLEVRLDPFIMAGDTRVRVYGDSGYNNEPTKYEVLQSNSGRAIYSFEGKDLKNVKHIKYSTPNGDSLIGTSPIIALCKIWAMKSKALSATETVFGNGLQASHIVSLEVDKMSDVRGGVKLPDIQAISNKLAEEMVQGMTGLRNKNKAIVSPVPITTTKIQSNNVEMETIKMIDFSNDETYIAYNLDKAVFDNSKSKYNNADLALDSIWKAIQPYLQEIFLEAEMNFVMPILDSSYDPEKYPLRSEFDPTTQDFETAKLKQETMSILLNSLASLNKNGVLAKPTTQMLAELQENGIDLSGAFQEFVEATTSQIGNDFTKITEKEKFSRADLKLIDPETGLSDFTKEIEALPKLQKAKKGLENKFLKFIQNATA